MNAVLSLCHFCELHGPNVLFATQVFHETKETTAPESQLQFYGQRDAIAISTGSLTNHCEACHALGCPEKAYLSNDHQHHVSYLSSREAPGSEAANLLRQACFRSLSCEGSPGREGPIYFGDETRGHALSRPFRLEDAHARGFTRWFSLVILMRDKTFLLNSWPYLLERLGEVVQALQSRAHQVRQADCKPNLRPANPKLSRSLADLTGKEDIFPCLHSWFTWILRAGGNRLNERINLPLTFNLSNLSDNFVDFNNKGPIEIPLEDFNEPKSNISELRRLRDVIGVVAFRSILYCLLLGRQIVVRADSPAKTRPLLSALKSLLPSRNVHVYVESKEYIGPEECNLLSLGTEVAVPKPCPEVARLDLLHSKLSLTNKQDNREHWRLVWGGELPTKCPTLLNKIDKALENPILNNKVVECQINALREEWSNIAKSIVKINSETDRSSLLKMMGGQEHDWQIIQFWASKNSEEGNEHKNGIF